MQSIKNQYTSNKNKEVKPVKSAPDIILRRRLKPDLQRP